MRSPVLVASVPVLALAVAWLRFERPADVAAAAGVAALALAPAAFRRTRHRIIVTVASVFGAAWIAFGAAPDALLPGRDARWFGPVFGGAQQGFLEFYEVTLPFDPATRPEMHGVTLLALFGFGLAFSLAVAWRRVVVAAAILVVGTGWPATLIDDRVSAAVGALALAALLWLFVFARARTPRTALLGAGAALLVIGVAATATTSRALARDALLDWKRWDPYRQIGLPVGVRYVWDADYSGIEFPDEKTVVLRIKAPKEPLYWRASTLDAFVDDHWIENLWPLGLGSPVGGLPDDPLLPPRAQRKEDLVVQEVEVGALRDDHVIAASTPVALESTSLGEVFFHTDSVVRAPGGLRQGQRYKVWSYAPRPSPQQLLASKSTYPLLTRRYLELERVEMPVYGKKGRSQTVERILADERYPGLRPYRGVWQQAQRIAGREKTPYTATLAIERWLRSQGGFRYEEKPPKPSGQPPLAAFLTQTKAGYCQFYAGSMALMLRLLGVPARVAVGFTSGNWKDGVWTVTDHNAHAWVEVWFKGWGWLPFDPTPGRGTIGASYTIASSSPEVAAALGAGNLQGFGRSRGADAGADALGDTPSEREEPARPWWVLAVLLGGALPATIGLAKAARRRLRYVTDDPRQTAAASRAELVDFLRDQGLLGNPDATLSELAEVLERTVGVETEAFVAAAGRARYGPPTGADAAARRARAESRRILRVLRTRLTTRMRLRGYLSLASLRREAPSVQLGER